MNAARATLLVMLAAGAGAGGGCISQHHGTYLVLSNRALDVGDLRLPDRAAGTRVTGEDVHPIVVVVGRSSPGSFEAALDDALRKGGGDVILDARVEYFFWYVPFVYGREGWQVTGVVVDATDGS